MSTHEQIVAARIRLEQEWDSHGSCGSCGWHAALYEHAVSDSELQGALDSGGQLELMCVNKSLEYEEREGHRGVRVFIGKEPVCTSCNGAGVVGTPGRVCPFCKDLPTKPSEGTSEPFVAPVSTSALIASGHDTTQPIGEVLVPRSLLEWAQQNIDCQEDAAERVRVSEALGQYLTFPVSTPALIAAGALRQLRHNDGSEGFVFAYDKVITDRVFASLEQTAAANSVRDWTEDSSQENGNYENICSKCAQRFIGNKHRRTCRVCDHPNLRRISEKEMLERKIHNLKRHIEDYCNVAERDAKITALIAEVRAVKTMTVRDMALRDGLFENLIEVFEGTKSPTTETDVADALRFRAVAAVAKKDEGFNFVLETTIAYCYKTDADSFAAFADDLIDKQRTS